MSYDTHRSWLLPFADTPTLELKADASAVTLVPVAPGEQPRVEAHGRGADRLDLRVERQGDTVRVEIEPFRHFTWWGGWDTRFVVHVPATIRAKVETSAGSIDARSLDGCDLDVKANAGRVSLDRVRGRLRLAADAGSITGRELAGRVWADTQAGSIRLELVGLDPGEHRVHASMGSIRVELARGLEVKVDSRASMGSSRVRYPIYPNAAAVLQLETEMGSIRVFEGSDRASSEWTTPAANVDVRTDVPDPPTAPPPPSPPPPPPAPSSPAPPAADAELERILKLVESGELSARDADDLLAALGRT
jgi:hypothetical protein